MAINHVSTGTLDTTLAHPREIFKAAILANAHSIIIAHNHPSGDTAPSANDICFTKSIISAGKILHIDVIDSIIIGDKNYMSFKDFGLMKEVS